MLDRYIYYYMPPRYMYTVRSDIGEQHRAAILYTCTNAYKFSCHMITDVVPGLPDAVYEALRLAATPPFYAEVGIWPQARCSKHITCCTCSWPTPVLGEDTVSKEAM